MEVPCHREPSNSRAALYPVCAEVGYPPTPAARITLPLLPFHRVADDFPPPLSHCLRDALSFPFFLPFWALPARSIVGILGPTLAPTLVPVPYTSTLCGVACGLHHLYD